MKTPLYTILASLSMLLFLIACSTSGENSTAQPQMASATPLSTTASSQNQPDPDPSSESLKDDLCNVKASATLRGKVVSVTDGDTITLLRQKNGHSHTYIIRLGCIDAPERGQPFSQRSKHALSELIFNKKINVTYVKCDRYGRIIGNIRLNGIDINKKMVEDGMAWVYRTYCSEKSYICLEEHAREEYRGIWSQPNPTPPWQYRKDPSHAPDIDYSAIYAEDYQVCTSEAIPTPDPSSETKSYQCGLKHYCTQMSSCEEAKYYFTICGLTRLDGDNDGTPCESLCYY